MEFVILRSTLGIFALVVSTNPDKAQIRLEKSLPGDACWTRPTIQVHLTEATANDLLLRLHVHADGCGTDEAIVAAFGAGSDESLAGIGWTGHAWVKRENDS